MFHVLKTALSLRLAALCLALAPHAIASQVYYGAHDTSAFSYAATPNNFGGTLGAQVAAGQELLNGTRVYIGTFEANDTNQAANDADIIAHKSDLSYLYSKFTEYGSQSTTPLIGDGTTFAGGLSGSMTTTGSPIAGRQIYYFVVAGTDNTSPSSTINSGFQLGIFYFDKSLNNAWMFPNDTDVPNTKVNDISDLTQGNNGEANYGLQLKTGAHILIGGFGPDTSNSSSIAGAKNFTLANVPEPSGLVLLAMGSFGISLFRRRVQ